MINKWNFEYYNSKGEVWLSYGELWGISVKIVKDGRTIDSWDGRLENMPMRFNKES